MKKFLDVLYNFASGKFARFFVLSLFVVQALFLAFTMHIGTPPDENNHINFIEYYAEHSPGPVFDNQTPSWSLGDKTREVDYLYHYVASWIARVVPGQTPEVYVLRVTTVLTALASFIVLIRLFKRLKISDTAINTSLAIVTNLPMVLMLSAAVNNDVAVWLGTILGALLVVRIWQRPTLLDVMWLLGLAATGGLVKRTLLPTLLVLVIVAGIFVIKKWKIFQKSFRTDFNWKLALAAVIFIFGTGLFIERVGGNIVRYHAIAPDCEAVQGKEACKSFWQTRRQAWIDAGAPASGNTWLAKGTTRDETLMPLPVFAARWYADSALNVVDIQTQGWRHKATPPLWLIIGLFGLLSVFTVYGIFYDLRRRKEKYAKWRLFVITIAAVVLAAQLAVNYSTYTSTHLYGIALNGRYILPALLLVAGLACFYAGKLLPRRVNVILAGLLIVATIVFSGLFMMVRNMQLFTG